MGLVPFFGFAMSRGYGEEEFVLNDGGILPHCHKQSSLHHSFRPINELTSSGCDQIVLK